jgi:hypothetical protein
MVAEPAVEEPGVRVTAETGMTSTAMQAMMIRYRHADFHE